MKRIVLLLVVVFLLTACGSKELPPVPYDPVSTAQITPQTYPKVDGSTSTLPLQTMVACQLLKIECDWQEGFLTSERAIRPVIEGEIQNQEAVDFVFGLSHSGTNEAYVNLIEAKVDLILVAREPSVDEINLARRAGVQLDVHPVAMDALVFLLHKDAPIDDLDVETIRAIYGGRIAWWIDLGVEYDIQGDTSIHTYQRNTNSGSQELMKSLVMQGERMIISPDMMLDSMIGPFNAISSDPLGIGYSVYFYTANILSHEDVRMIRVNGVAPTPESIADGSYPLTAEVYVVVRKATPSKNLAWTLRDWLLTVEGQQAVSASGYVPLVGE